MLLLMTGPFLIAQSASSLTGRQFNTQGAAAIGLGILFVFTGIGHFLQTDEMASMLPEWVPGRVPLVYLTGVLEFAIAAGFFSSVTRQVTGWVAAVMLLLFFPANVYAAFNHAPMGGHAWGPIYLLVRTPVQLAIILWIYWFTIRQTNETRHRSRVRPTQRSL